MITEKHIEPLKKAFSLMAITFEYVNKVSAATAFGEYKPSDKTLLMMKLITEARDECFKDSPDLIQIQTLIDLIIELKK